MTVRLLRGDCRDVLKTLADESVQCIVTSPPYWGLRSYLPEGHPDKAREIGSEPTVDEWVDTIVGVMRECRRVLRNDGVLFLNLGDSYANDGKWGGSTGGKHVSALHGDSGVGRRKRTTGLKPKDLIGQPWLAAFALRADGWWLRQEIIWHKPNPMPESAKDRCTKAHEHIFLLSKQATYFWNFEAIQEPVTGNSHPRGPGNKANRGTTLYDEGDEHHRTKGGLVEYAERKAAAHNSAAARKARANEAAKSTPGELTNGMRQYKSPDGWNTGPGAHGSFHPEGCEKGKYPGNGVGFGHGSDKEDRGRDRVVTERVAGVNPKATPAGSGTKQNESFSAAVAGLVDTRNPRSVWTIPSHPFKGSHYATFPPELARRCILAGSREGDVVLDPFSGSGTTALVADSLGRHCIGIDLDERNIPMAKDRLMADAPMFTEITT